jgi:hypothetical protein
MTPDQKAILALTAETKAQQQEIERLAKMWDALTERINTETLPVLGVPKLKLIMTELEAKR